MLGATVFRRVDDMVLSRFSLMTPFCFRSPDFFAQQWSTDSLRSIQLRSMRAVGMESHEEGEIPLIQEAPLKKTKMLLWLAGGESDGRKC